MEQTRPLLTIGMIVKNESRCLERCLKALQPLRNAIPCELIVADTGSTDNTREIAEQYADLVFDFPWNNDFSAARNAVLDRAAGEWYLSIDADEYLDPDISELTAFLRSKKSQSIDFGVVVVRSYFNPDMLGDYTDALLTRLLRLETGVRYQGKIHENFGLDPEMTFKKLDHIIFHHDGYAYTTEEAAQSKAKRNLLILEQELEEQPENLMRMLQCMESAGSLREEGIRFARRGMELAETGRELPAWSDTAPAMARIAVHTAYRYELPELEQWVQWSKREFPDSPFTQIDTAYFYMLWLYRQERYAEAAEEAHRYLDAMERYRGGGYSWVNFAVSSLRCSAQNSEYIALVLGADSDLRLGKKKHVLEALEKLSFVQAKPDITVRWLNVLEQLADDPAAQNLLVRKFTSLMDDSDGSDRSRVRAEAAFQRMAAAFLPGQSVEGWRLYIKLQHPLGAAARCMAAADSQQLQAAMFAVEQWELMPFPAISRAIALGAELPDSFYEQKSEVLREIAVSLAQYEPDWFHALLNWSGTEQTLKQLQFRFELLASALRDTRIVDHPKGLELVEKFISLSQTYLNRLYHPDVLQGEDWTALSGLHRGARLLVLASIAIKQHKWAESIRILRGALAEAPALKPAAELLLKEVQQQKMASDIQAVSPELSVLVTQVKTLLSRYPADDPAVEALKRSEIYQKVAYLIEDTEESMPS